MRVGVSVRVSGALFSALVKMYIKTNDALCDATIRRKNARSKQLPITTILGARKNVWKSTFFHCGIDKSCKSAGSKQFPISIILDARKNARKNIVFP